MEINENVKVFLQDKENQKLLNEYNFDMLYRKLNYSASNSHTSDLTKLLLSVDINPLNYMDYVPGGYMNNLEIDSIDIPDNIKAIGPFAFLGTNINDIEWPKALKEIQGYAFNQCEFKEIDLPEGLLEIGTCAFSECYDLRKVTFPSSLIKIGQWAFQDCSLEEVNYRGTQEQWRQLIRHSRTAFNIFPFDFKGLVHCVDGDSGVKN